MPPTQDAPQPNADSVHQYFQPYRRISPPWDMYERVKTTLVLIFIFPFRVLFALLCSILLAIISALALIAVKRSQASIVDHDENTQLNQYETDSLFHPLVFLRRRLLDAIFFIVRSVLFFSFGVYYIKHDKVALSDATAARMPTKEHEAYVIVANHLGYIDILVLLATFRGSFVAKGECESTPLIGLIARALQCMFVHSGKSLTSQLINRVRSTYHCHALRGKCGNCMSCSIPLVIFPEGTTSNGTAMVPFRTGVFNAGLPVKPVCIQFPYRHFNLSWETIRFREHMFRTMTQLRNNVHCIELPVYVPSEAEKTDARLYSANVQAEMARVLEQPIVPLNRKHKFLYHGYILGKEKGEAEVIEKAEVMAKADEQLVYFKNRSAEENV